MSAENSLIEEPLIPTPPAPLPYANKGDLTRGDIAGHLIRLTVPMIWGLFAVISIQLADTFFIAQLGTDALAGFSFTFPVTMILTHLVFGLNIALSSVVSRAIGAGDIELAQRVTLHGMLFATFVAAIAGLMTYLFMDPLFRLLGANETTLPYVHDFIPLWLIGSVILAIPVNANSAMRAAGDALRPMIVMTSMAAANVIIAPVLIFGLFGFPRMEVSGAALANVISYSISLCVAVYFLISQKKIIPKNGWYFDQLRNSFKRLIFIALPAGITNIIQPLSVAIITSFLASEGAHVVAAFGIATRVEALAMLLVISLALGLSPIVGQNWGARNFSRVHEAIVLSIRFNFIWAGIVTVILWMFAEQIAGAFSSDAGVIHQATLYFWIVPFSYGFSNLVFGWSASFNAMGLPQWSFAMIILKSFAITIPCVALGYILGGALGVFISLAVANIISGVIFHLVSWRVCRSREKTLIVV